MVLDGAVAPLIEGGDSMSWGEGGKYLGAWFLGVLAVILPWLAIRVVPVDVNNWASIYVAGALGGLALELLLGRGRIELPSLSHATADEQTADERRPLGPMVDLGFFARMASSGLAAFGLLLVYYSLVESAETIEAFNDVASDPATFGWAVFLGASSPAIWTASQRLVQARIEAVTAANAADLEQKNNALQLAREELTNAKGQIEGSRPAHVDTEALTDIEQIVGEVAAARAEDVDVADRTLTLYRRMGPPVETDVERSDAALASMNKALGILEAGIAQPPGATETAIT